MRLFLKIAIMLGLCLPTAAFAALPEVTAHLKATRTMTADFKQTAENGGVARGKLILARPGKVRFQYEKGIPLLVVSDGKNLAMIDYEVSQVSQYPIGKTPLSVLLNADADLAKYARVVSSNAARLVIEAKDRKNPEYGVITIIFERDKRAPAGLILRGWNVLDAQGNRTRIDLSNIDFNVPVSNDNFRYRDPRRSSRRPGR